MRPEYQKGKAVKRFLILTLLVASTFGQIVVSGQSKISGSVQIGSPPVTVTIPTVTTSASVSVTTVGATITGNAVTSNGGGVIVSEGTRYSTSSTPSGACSNDGTTTPFNSTLSGLASTTLYYYQACATNSAGIGYGSILTFTTLTPGSCSGQPFCAYNGLDLVPAPANPDFGSYANNNATYYDNSFADGTHKN